MILSLGSYLAPYVDPALSPIFPVLGLGYPVLLLCNVLAIIAWLLFRSKWVVLSLLMMVFGYTSCSRLLNVNIADTHSGPTLKVATYNANFSKPIVLTPEEHREEKEADFQNYLAEWRELDVLCVQEYGVRTKEYLESAIDFPFLYDIPDKTVAIYSRYPFVAQGTVDFQSNIANACLWVDIVKEQDTIRIYSTHLESNRSDGQVPDVILEDTPEQMSNSVLLGIVQHHQKFSIERARQAQLIKAHQQASLRNSVICGDFNETPQSYVFTILKKGMQDSFQEEGMGIASTFGERIPALRIDHLLVSEKLEVLDHTISRSDFSDHYLVVVDIGL